MKAVKHYNLTTAIIFGFAVVLFVIIMFKPDPPEIEEASLYLVWIHGTENDTHDQLIADLINADTTLQTICNDSSALIEAKDGDVFISARADSFDCNYAHRSYYGVAIVGASNATEDVGEERVYNSIYVSNGRSYGDAIDFIILDENGLPGLNQGDAMAYMANYVLAVNEARHAIGRSTLNTPALRQLFLEASTNKIIDIDLAIELATAPTSTPISCNGCGWLPGAVYYPILLDGE